MSGPNISKNAHDLARKHGLDVGQIKGTGRDGQITAKDVKETIAAKDKPADKALPAEPPAAKAPDDKPKDDKPKAKSRKVEVGIIERVSDGLNAAWWCPFCDFSQPATHTACAGCGATRVEGGEPQVGDEVERVDD